MILLAIAAGGAIGAVVRHLANEAMQATFGARFPVGIFLINVTGCFAIGVFAGLLASSRIHASSETRAFVVVGVLGGFTTFSSFGLDTFTLARGGHVGAAVANAFGQLFLGVAAVFAGYAMAQARL